MTEHEKMLAGKWYDASDDPALLKLREQADRLCHLFNTSEPGSTAQKQALQELLGVSLPDGLTILSPVWFDYGNNTTFGHGVFVNHNCYFMDGAPITIGSHVFFGPSCGLYTATHPLNFTERNAGYEKALPITVGDSCWFGANVTVLQGVTIGSGCVIGAGSVVKSDLPENSLAAGVPAKVIRTIDQNKRVL